MTANITFLQQEDLLEAGLLDVTKILDLCERCLQLLGCGEIINPPKTSIMRESSGHFRVHNTMPVYIGADINRAGVKWACESSTNPGTGDLPLGIDLLILSDPETVLPVAIMDATLITAMRTAANNCLAVKYLANPDSRVFGLIGAGVIGRTLLMTIAEMDFELTEMRICDLRRDKADALAAEFSDRLPTRVVETAEDAIRGSDVSLTATTAHRPIVDVDWLDTPNLLVKCASNEFPGEAILKADVVTVDDWNQLVGAVGSPLQQLHSEGGIHPGDVVHLRDIIAGNAEGRSRRDQQILHLSRGLGCLDVMVGDYLYARAQKMGLGTTLSLWDRPRWV